MIGHGFHPNSTSFEIVFIHPKKAHTFFFEKKQTNNVRLRFFIRPPTPPLPHTHTHTHTPTFVFVFAERDFIMLKTARLKAASASVVAMTNDAPMQTTSTSIERARVERPPISSNLLHDVFEGVMCMKVVPWHVMQNTTGVDVSDETQLMLPLPCEFEFMQTYGQLLPSKQPTLTTASFYGGDEQVDNRQAVADWKRNRMKRARNMFSHWTHQTASCVVVNDDDAAVATEDHFGGSTGDHHHDDDDNVCNGANAGRPSIMQTLHDIGFATPVPTTKVVGVPRQSFELRSQNVSLAAYDSFANERELTSHRKALTAVTRKQLQQMNARVKMIEKLMNSKACHYYAGPLESVETGERMTALSWPFTFSDEMEDADKALLRSLVPKQYVNSDKPPFILWGAAGDPIMAMLQSLPFVQIAPVKDKASVGKDRGFRQDLGYSIGTVSLYRAERKDWYDCINSYKNGHFQAQRATMTRCGMPNCCVDFIVEFPSGFMRLENGASSGGGGGMVSLASTTQTTSVEVLMEEFAMHRAIEATTLHQFGIHTRRTVNFFDTVNVLLDDVYKILEHGAAKFANRMDNRSVCFTPDTTLSASEALSSVGRKSDLDSRHQFVMSFKSSLMQITERSLHALYDRYGSVAKLVAAYVACPENDRDSMLIREVQLKDQNKYSIFGVKENEEDDFASVANAKAAGKRAPKNSAPFGPATSARIHRFLFNLPPLETKQSKGRANRKRVRHDDDDDE